LSPALAIPLFVVAAVLTLAAAAFFADKLDHVGPRIGLPESAVGLLTAVAADTPEIASAVVALIVGNKDVSLGVVLGSNVFNLASMIGLSAVLAGAVTIGRRALAVEGAVSVFCLGITAALVLGGLSAPLALILFLVIAIPYVIFTRNRHVKGEAVLKEILLMIPAVAMIVLGSFGMVKAALALADRWNVSQTVTGLLVLAVLTSLPNAFTAVRLGLVGRGDALVTEALASNTINLTGGILIPALFVGLASATTSVKLDFAWLGVMTLFALVALAARRGMGRTSGGVLIAMYLVFVAIHLAHG
jgi:cation:H+ antiporter